MANEDDDDAIEGHGDQVTHRGHTLLTIKPSRRPCGACKGQWASANGGRNIRGDQEGID